MAFEHPSGLPDTFERQVDTPGRQSLVFPGNRILQGADLNEMQSLMRARARRFGSLLVKDGDRIEGAEALVDFEEETVLLGDGKIFAGGDVLPVASALLIDVPMEGRVSIGVRVVRSWLTHEDDPTLLGLVPGSEGEGEPGAAREMIAVSWSTSLTDAPGDFVPVYELLDGTVIDQRPPPALTGVQQQIAIYDMDANGHYIVDGCEVTALGKTGANWLYSIGAGTANVQGYKRIRETTLRLAVPEEADLEDVIAESHNYDTAAGGAMTVAVNRAPIASLTSAVIVKRVTQNIVRGAVPGTMDDLQYNSALEIESVVQGATTFGTTTYALSAGKISWAPAGAEPAAGSTYSVTYLYSAEVTPTAITDGSVTVTGGVQNKPITLRYLSKLPRIDLICMEVSGEPRYVKGISSRAGGLAPIEPTSLLKLAEVHNNWRTLPTVVNNGVRNYTYAQQRRLFNRLIDVLDQFDRQSAQLAILASSPVSKKGIFTDNFVDDFYRDQGLAQTAAVNQGVLQLAIDPVMLQVTGTQPETMPYTEIVILSQTLRTSSVKINPYANFTAMPAGMRLDPSVDFWNDQLTEWTSDVTREFSAAPDQPPGQTTITEQTELRRSTARFLRQIDVELSLEGFGVGENLESLTFDGLNIKPAGTQTADANGELVIEFTIPPNVTTGTKLVRAVGEAGSFAEARFAGEGTIDVHVMRRVTLITREAAVPVINNITNVSITQITNTTINQITQQVIPPQPIVIIEPTPNREEGATPSGDSDGGGIGASWDPLAQTFMTPAPYMLIGVNFWVTAVGDPTNGIRVQLATVQNGYPTAVILAEDFISMATVEVGDKLEARFRLPVYCAPGQEYCFVILTDDPNHSVAIAKLGDVITETQEFVGAQPYTVGVMFTSANRLTWTAHQDADVAFELVAAKFTSEKRTVTLWTGPLDAISDILVRGTVELPTQDAGFHYELVRASGAITKLAPGQAIEFAEYVSETVTLRAVLTGGERIAPILYPGTMLAGGRIRTSGTYATRNFPFGSAVEMSALFAAKLPAGSAVAVDTRVDAGAWSAATLDSTGVLGDGWVEPKYKKAALTGVQGQTRLTITGGPAARPSIALLRSYTI